MHASSARSPTRGQGPDFIGIGAQRSGTSWMYACLYEHPRICMPRKEVNFFSRDRNWTRGLTWYEGIFAECPPRALSGEFSTSYLTGAEAPRRIWKHYPHVRLIASLRHPAERAYSSYLNDIVAGIVPRSQGFEEALEIHPEYLETGRYASHLRRYLDLFPREQILISIFDDARRDPLGTIRDLYRFLEVDPEFRPTMLQRRVGVGRVPRIQWAERLLLRASATIRYRPSLRPLWWTAKRLGVGDRLRSFNTSRRAKDANGLDPETRRSLIAQFEPEIANVEELLQTELAAWRR